MTSPIDGLYALASLDGAPLAPADLTTLGLAAPAHGGFAAGAVDCGVAVGSGSGVSRAFLGHLDDPAGIAAALRLSPATPAAEIVAAAAACYGDDAPAMLPGEWGYVGWNPTAATLTLLASRTLRDALMFATDGRRVAVAPHLRPLRRLSWVDGRPGPGLLIQMGRGTLRGVIEDRTMLRGVRWVEAGSRVTIERRRARAGTPVALPAPVRWSGSFGEAIAASDAAMRRVMRGHLARHPASAVMLSGGLDSSLVAVYAAAGRAPDGLVVAVTSAAPPGSGLADETEFAAAVAAQAGIAMRPVCPGPEGDPYLPSIGTLRRLEHPLVSPRHYVYDALYRVAAEAGADAILDGVDGEMSLTGWPDHGGWRDLFGWRSHLRRRATGLVRRLSGDAGEEVGGTQGAFHVRLSGDALAMARSTLRDELALPEMVERRQHRGGLWGYGPDLAKKHRDTTMTQRPGMRRLSPFRDRELLTLVAGFPYRFMTEDGVTRAPARALLAGRVPEEIRLRPRGRPFSPDYDDRLRRYAGAARARIPEQALAGAGEWIDLGWLDRVLAAIDGGAVVGPVTVLEAQMTACAAAFMAEWAAPDG
jgi:asparagine synthase (glutamine-hydrolysing)